MRVTLQEWNDFIENHPQAHILQTGAWGELKTAFRWKAVRVISGKFGAQVLFRILPGGYSIAYIPKGPIGMDPEFVDALDSVCREENSIFLKIEPDCWEPEELDHLFGQKKWIKTHPIQPRRTVIVPLDGTHDEILGHMKQKTRYNIRLAEKKEIKVCISDDIQSFHQISEITGQRDGFSVHHQAYYQKGLDLFKVSAQAALLMAYYQDKPVAGLMVFTQGDMAYYMYGASSDEERNRMPTYLIQWEAMKWAKNKGCKFYDLWESRMSKKKFWKRNSIKNKVMMAFGVFTGSNGDLVV